MSITTPWVISTSELEDHISNKSVLVIDVSSKDSYAKAHIPGAVLCDYASIVKHNPPVVGMLPEPAQLSVTLSGLGIKPDDYLVVYDEEGGGKASRLMWTLEIAGHKKMSLLDGGIIAWQAENKPTTQENTTLAPSDYPVIYTEMQGVADADYILAHMQDDNTIVLDTRSENEYNGLDVRANRGGHIPGAVNIDWLLFKNPETQKLRNNAELTELLNSKGVSKEKEIIVHCHSHHRSALIYVALKNLDYEKVKGYPASWSDWAARTDTPIEI